jgi:hypothetical protein
MNTMLGSSNKIKRQHYANLALDKLRGKYELNFFMNADAKENVC